MRINKGTIIDRLVTPYVIYTYLPSEIKYVSFPFGVEPSILPPNSPANPTIADYQQKRFYSDEVPLKLEDFTINGKIPKNGKLVEIDKLKEL